MKVREDYLMKENVSQMMEDYEELKQTHDQLAQEQQSSVRLINCRKCKK